MRRPRSIAPAQAPAPRGRVSRAAYLKVDVAQPELLVERVVGQRAAVGGGARLDLGCVIGGRRAQLARPVALRAATGRGAAARAQRPPPLARRVPASASGRPRRLVCQILRQDSVRCVYIYSGRAG